MVRSAQQPSSSALSQLCRNLRHNPGSLKSLHLAGTAIFRPSPDFYRVRGSSDWGALAELVRLLREQGPRTKISKIVLGDGLSQGTVELLLNKGIIHLGKYLQHLEIDGSIRISSTLFAKVLTQCPKLESIAVWSKLEISSHRALIELNQAIHNHASLKFVHLLQVYAVAQESENAAIGSSSRDEDGDNDDDDAPPLEMAATSVDDEDEEEENSTNDSSNESHSSDNDSAQSFGSSARAVTLTTPTTKPTTLCLSCLVDAFATVPQLTRLQLSSAFGSGSILGSSAAAESLANLVRSCIHLSVLVLHNVGLGDVHAQALAHSFQNQSHLYHVDLRENKDLQESSYMAFLQGLEQSNVQYLDLIPDEQKERFNQRKMMLDSKNKEYAGFEHLVQGLFSRRRYQNDNEKEEEALYNVHDWIETHLQLNRAGRYTLLKNPHATPEEKLQVLHKLCIENNDDEENSNAHHSLDMIFLLCRSNPIELLHLFSYDSESKSQKTRGLKLPWGARLFRKSQS